MSRSNAQFRIQNTIPYDWMKPILFRMAPEQSHHFSMSWLQRAYRAKLTGPSEPLKGVATRVAGLHFSNRVGLAAGLDKNAEFIDALGSLGFGFIEVGTVTPKPQAGNEQPRLFRLKNHQAIINRMGFNNYGIEAMVTHLQRRSYTGLVGVNIGKNKDTPQERAAQDYIVCMSAVFGLCDYLTVNISSPNTEGLRALQEQAALADLLRQVKTKYAQLVQRYQKRPPLFLKVAPDLSAQGIADIAKLALEYELDGLVVSNTTIDRSQVETHLYSHQAGGLSGAPLRDQSTQVIQSFRQELGPDMPIIGVGGIFCAHDGQSKLEAGADLVQIYTGFIYEGPKLVRDLVRAL